MNKKHFYTHLIEIDSLTVELDQLDLSQDEKLHLAQLVDENLHHKILDAIFDELDDDHKRLFIEHLSSGDHGKIWEFLNDKTDNIEEKIKKTAKDLKEELTEDVKEAKEK